MTAPRPHITVVGLGPAGSAHLSSEVTALMADAERVFLRTARHPAAEAFGPIESFDQLYESAETFDALYGDIVEHLVAAAVDQAPIPVLYAVPGSPLVAERTVELLRADPRVDLTVIPALSFLDLAWERLGVDPLQAGIQIVDAECFAAQAGGQHGPFLVAQCWAPALLSDIKLSVEESEDRPLPQVTLLHHLGLEDEQVRVVDWWELDRTLTPDHLTSLYIPALEVHAAGSGALADLETLMGTLRAECPWDQVQTHATLMPHLVEETYEVLDALEALGELDAGPGAFAHLEEELGDLLFQIVFHACLAEEEGHFTLDDVARGVHDKLVHRHPHVFGTVTAETPGQVLSNWEAIKKEEKGRTSVTEGIPAHLPALILTAKLQRKARSVGMLDVGKDLDSRALLDALVLRLAAGADNDPDAPLIGETTATEVIGRLLFDVTDMARQLGVDAEQALRRRAAALRAQIVATETAAGSAD